MRVEQAISLQQQQQLATKCSTKLGTQFENRASYRACVQSSEHGGYSSVQLLAEPAEFTPQTALVYPFLF